MQQMVRVELWKCCLSALTKIIIKFRIKILLNTLSPCSQFTSINSWISFEKKSSVQWWGMLKSLSLYTFIILFIDSQILVGRKITFQILRTSLLSATKHFLINKRMLDNNGMTNLSLFFSPDSEEELSEHDPEHEYDESCVDVGGWQHLDTRTLLQLMVKVSSPVGWLCM